jgi:hypothetical protein
MVRGILFIAGWLVLTVVAAQAQSVETLQVPPPDEQNETMRDTLKRMQIKREEEEHKKLLSRGFQIKQDVETLLRDAANERLPRSVEKRLKEIEKSAKNIRSQFGGSEDVELESPPQNLNETLKLLTETTAQLNDRLAKTSRQVISIQVVESCTDIIQLVKMLRAYLN